MRTTVTIGGASAMWGDSAIATPQLLRVAELQYLVYDYLAETTMSILARARERNPAAGYATDFVTLLEPHLDALADRRIKVIANAGGLNPLACASALGEQIAARGGRLRVAAVTGDDVMPLVAAMVRDDAVLPDSARLVSASAYLGARAIADALERGADIVITGRTVDSALVVGPLVHEFGWDWHDYDRLAQATVAGHVIECGAQATGGLFTDWAQVPDWHDIGYPVIVCTADGGFVVTKPAGTGGLVSPATVAEQIVYEIGDPAAYAMPDVICDLRGVSVQAAGPGRVRVTGARGRAPSGRLKVSATLQDGYQLDVMLAIRGIDAPAKARRTAEALLVRTRRQMAAAGYGDYRDVVVELLGCEALYGPHARALPTREVVLRIAVAHRDQAALEFLRRETPSTGTSMGPGTRGHFGGRSDSRPVIRHWSCGVDESLVRPVIHVDTVASPLDPLAHRDVHAEPGDTPDEAPPPGQDRASAASLAKEHTVRVPLVFIAHARSGDKGDDCNIGVIARRPEWFDVLRDALTAERVRAYCQHLMAGDVVERFELPGLRALNFVLHQALGGGGMASLRSDPLGKSFAQMLLDLEIEIPPALLDERPVEGRTS